MNKRLFVFVPLLCAVSMMAEHIIVQPRSGADLAEDIAVVGKWSFVGNMMLLIDHQGDMLGYEKLNNITRITFEERAPIPTSTETPPNAITTPPSPNSKP